VKNRPQLSFEKNHLKCSPTHILSKLTITLKVGKSGQVGYFCTLQKQTKVNNRPMGEVSPILVTLLLYLTPTYSYVFSSLSLSLSLHLHPSLSDLSTVWLRWHANGSTGKNFEWEIPRWLKKCFKRVGLWRRML
jgi:hypothetical protein